MKASEFDKKFDEGVDIINDLDIQSINYANTNIEKIELELPKWMIDALDLEANKIGTDRNSIIKFFLSEKL